MKHSYQIFSDEISIIPLCVKENEGADKNIDFVL
jgi:hypothetical protein